MALGEGVGVVAILGVYTPDTRGAVEGVSFAAGLVAKHGGDEVLLRVTKGDEVAVGRRGRTAEGGRSTP